MEHWQKMKRVPGPEAPSVDKVRLNAKRRGVPFDEALKTARERFAAIETWANNLYIADVDRRKTIVLVTIRSHDGEAILRDWRHFQAIKNDVLGPEWEAVEIYPSESRKVDAGNNYHLFGFPKPLNFGFFERDVRYTDSKAFGLRQRPETMKFD